MLIDIHCHLDFKDFEKDLDKVIERAEKNNFISLIANGVDHESNLKVLEISKKYKIVKPALGLYPDRAIKLSEKEIDKEIDFIRKNKPFAIGETGIDHFRVENPEKQKKAFKKFIDLAKELDIPIIVHSRKAEQDVIEILEKSKIKKVILHCFSGNKELIERAEENGWMFSIPTSIVKNKTFKKLAKRISLNKILTETDAPYLSPFEGKRNEPSFILESLKKIAEIKGITQREIENIIFSNYQRMFKL